MMEEKVDYIFDMSEEMTEEKLETVPEAEKMMIRWYMENNPEKKVIEIRPGSGGCISLHGAQDARNFIEAIEEAIQQMFQS